MSTDAKPRPAPKAKAADKREIPIRFVAEIAGVRVEFSPTMQLEHVPILLRKIAAMGARFEALPLIFQHTAEGTPICPVHAVPMTRHEKQGDVWFSHRANLRDGSTVWCRGFHAEPETDDSM